MMTSDVRDWLKNEFPEFEDVVIGRLSQTKREKLLLIKRGVTRGQQIAVGGLDNSSYARLACNCILHWNKNSKEAESKAIEIHDFLLTSAPFSVNGYKVAKLEVRNFTTLNVDENDIYEYAIDFEIIYNRLKG